jgi:TM2 domain-containing membrane protein YozV
MIHPNKTLATLLAALLGGLGVHRFYLRGLRDRAGWVHLASAPLSLLLIALLPDRNVLFTCAPLVLSILAGFLEALVLGLTPDEKWDAAFGRTVPSASNWPLAVILVLTMGIGTTALIGAIARLFDLLYTGGAYG